MAGRPTKYTPETVTKITNALVSGASRRAAAEYAGVSVDSFERWMKRYADFAATVTRAEAQCETSASLALRQAWAGGDWRAAAWWLERRRHEDWGRQDKVEIGPMVRDMARAAGVDEDEAVREAEQILRDIRRRYGRG